HPRGRHPLPGRGRAGPALRPVQPRELLVFRPGRHAGRLRGRATLAREGGGAESRGGPAPARDRGPARLRRPLDQARAAAWFRKAADQGHAYAQQRLGVAYRDGAGVPADRALSLQWFRRAAERGSGFAEAELGLAYETGAGLPRDPAEAQKLYRRAADHGDP